MDGIKQQIRAKQIETLENKHMYEKRKLNREFKSEIDKISEQNKAAISEVKKEYDKKLMDEKGQLELELITLRKKNDEVIKNENQRFESLIAEVKAGHKDKINEVTISQDKEMEKRETEHRNYLENLEQKFTTEKRKLEAEA